MVDILIVTSVAYLFGSFPTAIIAGKLLKKIDIREHGSGNAGATNVLRILGWKAGLAVLLIDMLKGFIPVYWLTSYIVGLNDNIIYYQILAAGMAIIGHIWTIFAGFKGGKGVGTAAGVFLGLAPLALSLGLLVFSIVVASTRYVSLGSLAGSLTLLITLYIQKFFFHQELPEVLIYMGTIVVALIWYAHRSNIKRLLEGAENKVSFSGKS
jgi:glycerol-3-phosphate acyltransferase PlsY